jgi:small subunit ribosomal protein S9
MAKAMTTNAKKGAPKPAAHAADAAELPSPDSSLQQQKKEAKPRISRKKVQVALSRGKRKESVARASVKKGKGVVRVNSFKLESLSNRYLKSMISEPLEMAGDLAKDLDIDVSVYGGGPSGQAEAVRQAIARGIVKFTGSEELKGRMVERDRFMLVEDSRRVEPKKYKGPKARARFQKSYR